MGCVLLQDGLVKIAKKLKKNNVAVDIVSFGCEEENKDKLEAFQAAVNSGDNSHLVSVPAGTILSDMLFATPIFMEEGGTDTGGAAAVPQPNIVDGFDYSQLGVDPTLDPELALALRISMEEERARVEAAAAEGNEAKEGEDKAAAVEEEPKEDEVEAMDEDTLLQQALALSMQGGGGDAAQDMDKEDQNGEEAPVDDDVEVDDPELALALQMSMGDQQQPPPSSSHDDDKKEDKNDQDA